MTIRVTHAKVNQVADWTQSKLDELINAGIYPQGTLITDITLPSDWNDDHTSTDLDYLEDNVRGAVIVDMDNDDYTMTIDEAVAAIKVIANPGTNKTLTFPTTSDALIPAVSTFITAFASGPFTVACETGGSTSEVVSTTSDQLYVIPGTSVLSEYNDYISQDAYGVSWDVNNRAPTQKEVYSILTGGHQVGPLKLAAGTATANTQPLEIASGTLLTVAEAGSVEYNGVQLYGTVDTTSGRGVIPVEQFFYLSADGGAITTIANMFGANSNIALVPNAHYEIEIDFYYLNTTSGTVGFTFTNSSAPTCQNIHTVMSATSGFPAFPGGAAYLESDTMNDTTAALTMTTGTLTTAVNHYANFKFHLQNGSGTSLLLQAVKNVGGSITPQNGSFWRCRRLPSSNVGTFVA